MYSKVQRPEVRPMTVVCGLGRGALGRATCTLSPKKDLGAAQMLGVQSALVYSTMYRAHPRQEPMRMVRRLSPRRNLVLRK